MKDIKTLYIIGNGFDIHHGMPTAFVDFYHWMINHSYFDAITKIEEIYGITDDKWWSDFEKSLGEVEMYEYAIEQTRENYPDYGSDEFREGDRYAASYQAELDITQMVDEMKSRFSEWIETMQVPNVTKKLPISIKDAFFVSFNYTPTLEKLYHVSHDQILHIHGSVLEDSDYVLGHGKSYMMLQQDLEAQEPSPSPNASPEEIQEFYDNNYDQIYEDTKESVLTNIASIQKPVNDIIERNGHIFDKLQHVKRICIYGLSFSEIDMKYIDEILKRHNSQSTIIWEISYYSEHDKNKIEVFVSEHNIPRGQLSTYTLNELQNKNQLRCF